MNHRRPRRRRFLPYSPVIDTLARSGVGRALPRLSRGTNSVFACFHVILWAASAAAFVSVTLALTICTAFAPATSLTLATFHTSAPIRRLVAPL